MKWSEEKVELLKSLALAGTTNVEIARQLNAGISDVYAKRSQLGITIDKVKAAKATIVNPNSEKALSTPVNMKRIDTPKRSTEEIARDLQIQFQSLSNTFEKISALFVEVLGSKT